jgi:cytochrome c peroxidase
VSFKNTRDVNNWEVPEVSENLNTDNNMGNLDLTDQEIDDIIAFLMALTDL